MGNSLRLGGPSGIQLERFAEALNNPSSGLTYPALTGTRKQSVQDVERLFGSPLIDFMKEMKYEKEANFIQIVRNWRKAVDERGLTVTQRLQYNQDLMNFLLDDLMPWHNQSGMRDFGLLEVNRLLFFHTVVFCLCNSIADERVV